MNLELMFQAQKELREHIGYNGEDRFEKLILALLVEIAECANEWRGFKFWSEDQEPRLKVICPECEGLGERHSQVFNGPYHLDNEIYKCSKCDGTGYLPNKNPLLEEYVDGLHFVLELGIESGVTPEEPWWMPKAQNVLKAFTSVYHAANSFGVNREIYEYRRLFALYMRLGETLGFTEEQIETAYYQKNEINHKRQEESY